MTWVLLAAVFWFALGVYLLGTMNDWFIPWVGSTLFGFVFLVVVMKAQDDHRQPVVGKPTCENFERKASEQSN